VGFRSEAEASDASSYQYRFAEFRRVGAELYKEALTILLEAWTAILIP
jgi:hypothetical protein